MPQLMRMAQRALHLLSMTLLAGCTLAWAPESRTQEQGRFPSADTQGSRLESGSLVVWPEDVAPDLPLVVVLPYTGGTAQKLFEWHYRAGIECECVLLLLPGRGSATDYATSAAWTATLERYESDIARDLDTLTAQGLQPRKILLAGFSMGGDLAWALNLRNPQRFDGGLVMGSRMSYRNAAAIPTLLERGARFFLTMGDQEQPARIQGMDKARALLAASGIAHEHRLCPGAHVAAPAALFEKGLSYLIDDP